MIYKVYPDRQPRVLSIYGGKLTAYRATAEQVMSRIQGSLPVRQRRGDTAKIRLNVPTDVGSVEDGFGDLGETELQS